MDTKQIIDAIFRDPKTKYELTEFNFSKPIHEIINIYPKTEASGKDAGKTKYYLKSFVPFSTGNEEVQVYVEDGKSAPEEIIRQLWIYKLIEEYGYKKDEIELEKSIHFGTEVGTKSADIVVYRNNRKETPKILIEVKKPKRQDGIEQLKSYLNAEGSPVGVWSNGAGRVILYRPYPKDFDTLNDIPNRNQEPQDVLEISKTVDELDTRFDFKKIIQDLEELVLADSGADEFNEIFKIIFAKIWDEKQADEVRDDRRVEFKKFIDPELTYERINNLFRKASDEWSGIFEQSENIKLRKDHLQVCIGPISNIRLMGSNLRIMDDAFEYLIPTEAKKKKGQFFTPRFVIDMCVRMLNPKRNEYVMDPSCGSAGFLLHSMEWCYPTTNSDERELRKSRYASKYLWGIDFEARAAKTSRALMLIAGDGHSNIFGPDVNSLEPKTWYNTVQGRKLMEALRSSILLKTKIPENDILKDEDSAWEYFENFNFDVILSNPPFAGEIKDKKLLGNYDLAKPFLKRARNKTVKVERDVLFIERIIKLLKPGGRAAIVLPQGKFNNASLSYIREYLFRKGRILAVVGLHVNTFKPHTATKTSVLFIQKYTDKELEKINKIQDEAAKTCPKYEIEIKKLIDAADTTTDIPDDVIPEAIIDLMHEEFGLDNPEDYEGEVNDEDVVNTNEGNEKEVLDVEEMISAKTKLVEDLMMKKGDLQNKIIALDQELEEIVDNHKELINNKREEYDQRISYLKNDIDNAKEEKNKKVEELRKAKKQDKVAQVRLEFSEKENSFKLMIKELREEKTKEVNELKKQLKEDEKTFKESKRLEKKQAEKELKGTIELIDENEYEIKLLTNKGKLQLLLESEDSISKLKERYIDLEVSKQLDYPVFMAISEDGGKSNSGDYSYSMDGDGNILEDEDGNPITKQDLVNYSLDKNELQRIDELPESQLCIAESFIKFAKENDFSFWRN